MRWPWQKTHRESERLNEVTHIRPLVGTPSHQTLSGCPTVLCGHELAHESISMEHLKRSTNPDSFEARKGHMRAMPNRLCPDCVVAWAAIRAQRRLAKRAEDTR